MRHVVHSHVLWSVDYEKSEYGVQDVGNFQKLVSTRVVEDLTVLWAGLVGEGWDLEVVLVLS